jgi:hypothetical protein
MIILALGVNEMAMVARKVPKVEEIKGWVR